MNVTAWVAVAGIGGTLLGTLLAPVLTEWMRRKSARAEQLSEHRIVVYADLLSAAALLADNASEWSAIPLAELKETPADELDGLLGRIRVIASDDVYKLVKQLVARTHVFHQRLYMARLHHHQVHDAGAVDDAQSLQQRMSLAETADQIAALHERIEAAVRKEMGR